MDANVDVNANDANDNANPNMEEFDANELAQLLQKKMCDLKAETCRQLIACEDEKLYCASGNAHHPKSLTT